MSQTEKPLSKSLRLEEENKELTSKLKDAKKLIVHHIPIIEARKRSLEKTIEHRSDDGVVPFENEIRRLDAVIARAKEFTREDHVVS